MQAKKRQRRASAAPRTNEVKEKNETPKTNQIKEKNKSASLSQSLLHWLALFLDDRQTLCSASRVCKNWHAIIESEAAWQSLFKKDWEVDSLNDPIIAEQKSWKARYKTRLEIESRWANPTIQKHCFIDFPYDEAAHEAADWYDVFPLVCVGTTKLIAVVPRDAETSQLIVYDIVTGRPIGYRFIDQVCCKSCMATDDDHVAITIDAYRVLVVDIRCGLFSWVDQFKTTSHQADSAQPIKELEITEQAEAVMTAAERFRKLDIKGHLLVITHYETMELYYVMVRDWTRNELLCVIKEDRNWGCPGSQNSQEWKTPVICFDSNEVLLFDSQGQVTRRDLLTGKFLGSTGARRTTTRQSAFPAQKSLVCFVCLF